MNFGDDGYDASQMQVFVIGITSEFYPDISKLYRKRIARFAAEHRRDDPDDQAMG